MNKDNEEALTGLAALLGLPIIVTAILLYGSFVNGLVGSCLWRWFAVPLGAPPVGLWHMAGLMSLIALLRGGWGKKSETDYLGVFLTPWIVLFTGWLVSFGV